MKAIIAFFLSIIFAIEGFFAGFFPNNQKEIKKIKDAVEFYCDGISENGLIRYGVVGDINLFEPNEDIKIIFECKDSNLYGTKAKITVKSEQNNFSYTGIFDIGSESAQYSCTFSSALNGIYDITIKTADNNEYVFSVGIVQRNIIASTDFYYGIQPYITRAQIWGEAHRIPGLNEENSIDAILNTAEYMGVNLIREDGVSWSGLQSSAYGDVDFSTQDYLINKVTSHGMKYNWILGDGTTEWSISDNYKNGYDATTLWAYAPNESMWDDYVTKLAEHYAGNENILWEIWNEPNWEFFKGTQEEYFTLLENTAKIIKSKNNNAYVYSGGLAVAERDTNTTYFTKYAELISKGYLDNWGYHNHDCNDIYCDNVNYMLSNSASAGLTGGGINSESGINGVDASLIARKALYTRATGANGFVSYSFREANGESGDLNDYAFFDNYLQPKEAVITYSTVIRLLGNTKFISSTKLGEHTFCDEYRADLHTIYVYYSFNEKKTVTLPDYIYSAFDMYGNSLTLSDSLTVNQDPVYVIT